MYWNWDCHLKWNPAVESFAKVKNSFANGRSYMSIYFISSDFSVKIFLQTGCTLVSNYSPGVFINQKGKDRTLQWRNLTGITLTEGSVSLVIRFIIILYPRHETLKRACPLWGLLLKHVWSNNHEKTPGKHKLGNMLQNNWHLQMSRSHKTEKLSKVCCDQGDKTTNCNVRSWAECWDRYICTFVGKNGEIWIKSAAELRALHQW